LKLLGIVVAMAAEARTLTKQPIASHELVYLSESVVMLLSGIGPRQARLAARKLFDEGANALLSWGSAGGLTSRLSPGSLVLPKAIMASNQSVYSVDPIWHGALCNRLKGHVAFHEGPLAESTGVLRNPSEKMALFDRMGAIAVDMESAAIAAVAEEANISFMAIRAISDPADMTIPSSALTAFDKFGRLNLLKLLKGLLRHPKELSPLIRLGQNFRSAQTTLSTVAHLMGNNLLVS
jgi:adenosylhomocysteine nucleosidase